MIHFVETDESMSPSTGKQYIFITPRTSACLSAANLTLPSHIHIEAFVFILTAIACIFNQVIELQAACLGNILRNCEAVSSQ